MKLTEEAPGKYRLETGTFLEQTFVFTSSRFHTAFAFALGTWAAGPVSFSRKMVINALNSGSKVFMADFEDANSPTWEATLQGQINVRDAVRRTITFTSPEGKVVLDLSAKQTRRKK